MLSNMLVTLDLDETLIHYCGDNCPYNRKNSEQPYDKKLDSFDTFFGHVQIRPGTIKFIKSLVDKGIKVGVWTAGTSTYAEPIVKYIFDKVGYKPVFVKTRKDCKITEHIENGLRKITTVVKEFKEFVKKDKRWFLDNSVIVDDNLDTCAFNLDHSIPIKPWYGHSSDNMLEKLSLYICDDLYHRIDIRHTNKVDWDENIIGKDLKFIVLESDDSDDDV